MRPPRRMSRPSSAASATRPKTSTTMMRTPSWPLVSRPRCTSGHPDAAERTASSPVATASSTKAMRRTASCDGVRRGQDEGDEEDRPDLAHRAHREDLRPEGRPQLPGVTEDRDQEAERRGGERRARVEERDDEPRGLERAADRVGQGDRQQPAGAREARRPPADAPEVDLVAREEEEHPEAEVGEQLRRRADVCQAEHLRADDDAQEQLEDHHRRGAVPGARRRDEEAGQRRRGRDDQQGRGGPGAHG